MWVIVCESNNGGFAQLSTAPGGRKEFSRLRRELEAEGYHSPRHLPTGGRVNLPTGGRVIDRVTYHCPSGEDASRFTVTLWEL